MLFNSIQFVIYLPIVFLLYWFVFDRFISKSKHQLCLQNAFIVVASYVFCTYFDPDFNSKSRICSKIPSLDFSFVFFMSLVVAMLNNYLQKLIRYDKLQDFVLDKVNRIL